MTTNQAIDGTTRELKPCPFCGGSADLKCTAGDYPDWFVQCTECHASADVFGPGAVHHWNDRKLPAVQAQGDPVAWQRKSKNENGRWFALPDSDVEEAIRLGYEVRKLYAEQPAPVAVVLPERKTWDGLRATACNLKAEAWNACLDEVTRLTATVLIPERLVMTDGLHTYEYVTGHNAAIDKMLGIKS